MGLVIAGKYAVQSTLFLTPRHTAPKLEVTFFFLF